MTKKQILGIVLLGTPVWIMMGTFAYRDPWGALLSVTLLTAMFTGIRLIVQKEDENGSDASAK